MPGIGPQVWSVHAVGGAPRARVRRTPRPFRSRAFARGVVRVPMSLRSPAPGAVFYRPQQRVPVHVLGDEVLEALEPRFAGGGEGLLAGRPVEAALARDEAQSSCGRRRTPSPRARRSRRPRRPSSPHRSRLRRRGLTAAAVDPAVTDLVPRTPRVPEERRPALRDARAASLPRRRSRRGGARDRAPLLRSRSHPRYAPRASGSRRRRQRSVVRRARSAKARLRPRERSPARSATVALVPGIIARSAESISAGEVVKETKTPGS